MAFQGRRPISTGLHVLPVSFTSYLTPGLLGAYVPNGPETPAKTIPDVRPQAEVRRTREIHSHISPFLYF